MSKLILVLFISASFEATLPYEFINCKQQTIKERTYLLKDKKRKYHVICDPEQHYRKPFRNTDSIIIIEDAYDMFLYANIEGSEEKAWFRINGQPRTKKENTRHYYGPWKKGEFRKKILPRLHRNKSLPSITPKKLWKQLKKEKKKEG